MLPDYADLLQAFVVPAVGFSILRKPRPSDDEARQMLDRFRAELRMHFEAERERQTSARAKLYTTAAELAPRVTSREIGAEIAHIMQMSTIQPLEMLLEQYREEHAALVKMHRNVFAMSEKSRPALQGDVRSWVNEGRECADGFIAFLEQTLVTARKVEADFLSGDLAVYLDVDRDEGRLASFDEQMAAARRMAAKYRGALRELAK